MKPFLKYGLLAGLFSVVWTLIMYVSELDKGPTAKPLGWISVLASLVFIFLAVRDTKKEAGNFISFGSAFKAGILTMLVSGIIGITYFYIHAKYLDPSLIDHIVETTRSEMSKQQNMTEEQMEQAWKYTVIFLTPGALAFMGLIMHLIAGTIGALLVAAILKKEPPLFNDVSE